MEKTISARDPFSCVRCRGSHEQSPRYQCNRQKHLKRAKKKLFSPLPTIIRYKTSLVSVPSPYTCAFTTLFFTPQSFSAPFHSLIFLLVYRVSTRVYGYSAKRLAKSHCAFACLLRSFVRDTGDSAGNPICTARLAFSLIKF